MIFRRSSKRTPPAPTSQPLPENRVTVEDLLHYKKRAEQPQHEFWGDFERQLKERQRAAAIQEKRTWRHSLPRIAIAIPVGATAAIAIGFIVWRNAAPTTPPATGALAQQSFPGTESTASNNPDIAPYSPITPPAATSAETQFQHTAVATIEQPTRATAAEAATTQPVHPEHLESARTVFATLNPARIHRPTDSTISFFNAKQQSTKVTSTATLFAEPVVIDSELIAALPSSTTSSAQTTNVTTTTAGSSAKPEDPADVRRERLLTYIDNTIPAAVSNQTDNPRVTRLRDRVTSRFDDKALSDSISRVATTGDTLTIKF